MPVKLSLAEKVRRAHTRGLRNRDIAKKYRITPRRVGRILWEARHKDKRQAWETEWKRKQYATNTQFREARLSSARRRRQKLEEMRTP